MDLNQIWFDFLDAAVNGKPKIYGIASKNIGRNSMLFAVDSPKQCKVSGIQTESHLMTYLMKCAGEY